MLQPILEIYGEGRKVLDRLRRWITVSMNQLKVVDAQETAVHVQRSIALDNGPAQRLIRARVLVYVRDFFLLALGSRESPS